MIEVVDVHCRMQRTACLNERHERFKCALLFGRTERPPGLVAPRVTVAIRHTQQILQAVHSSVSIAFDVKVQIAI